MCGIILTCYSTRCENDTPLILVEAIKARGPHSFSNVNLEVHLQEQPLKLDFAASVLALRGGEVVTQPLQDEATGSLLCWNGEAWKIGNDPIIHDNDASSVFQLLVSASAESLDRKQDAGASIRAELASIVGPFSFVFLDHPHRRIFYGRDVLGRRSLVWRSDSEGSLTISSVGHCASGVEWKEVDADGIYEISLTSLHPRNQFKPHFTSWESLKKVFPPLNREPRPQTTDILHAELKLVEKLREVLRASIATRLTSLLECPSGQTSSAKLAILFSGGLDCTLLARLTHDTLPHDESVDLLNVAFENPRVNSAHKDSPETPGNSIFERCPDRITARASHRELVEICPGRNWNLVTIDVPFVETQEHRPRVIHLMHPHDTEMDLSISIALYFASRGKGNVERNGTISSYESQARVLFSGLGADELFGGYGRHLVAFKRGGEQALADELELDFQRIAKRNLGRDDRVIAHWGKEVRYPFLDEDLVTWALNQPVFNKCDFASVTEDQADGERHDPAKGILRSLTRQLGMMRVANEKKRAIQFGARTAKMHHSKVKGTQKIQLE